MMAMSRPWGPVRQLTAIAFPFGRDDADSTTLVMVRWGLHVALWGCLLAALWHLNRFADIERLLRSPWPAAHRAWLPLLAAAVYALAWLSRALWLSLEQVAPVEVWPEFESAWAEARTNLERAQIDLQRAPIFLILGPFTREVRAWLDGLGAAPMSRSGEPFHVFANADAVFLVVERPATSATQARPTPLQADASVGPLRYLCQRTAEDRIARLPMQGMVLVVTPLALQSAAATRTAIEKSQTELHIVRRTLGLEIPLFLVLAGLPAGPDVGAAWLARFPPVPDLDPAEVPAMVATAVDWLFLEQIPADLRGCFRVEDQPTAATRLTPIMNENVQLYRWLVAVQSWRARLVEWALAGTRTDDAEPGMVAGCYLLNGPSTGQALWHDLLSHQHTFAWTPDAIARNAERAKYIRCGYALGFAAFGIGSAILGWLVAARW